MIDLWALRQAIRDQIEADQDCYGIKTEIEREMIVGPGDTPSAIIYLEDRQAIDNEQVLAPLPAITWQIGIMIMVGAFSLGGFARAVQRRDAAISSVEAALLRDRRLGGLVADLWLRGGRMLVAPQERGVLAWGEVRLAIHTFDEV